MEGGHSIPDEVIERRYLKGIKNLYDIYLNIVDGTLIFDNSFGKHELIAQKIEQEDIIIFDHQKYNQLKSYYDKKR
ncbi:putative ABC-type ATPase [Psychroflexus sp. MBR-150]